MNPALVFHGIVPWSHSCTENKWQKCEI